MYCKARKTAALILITALILTVPLHTLADTSSVTEDGRTVTVSVGETEFTENRTMNALESVQPDMSMWPSGSYSSVTDLWGNGLRGHANTDDTYIDSEGYPYTLVANGLCSRIMVQFDSVIPRAVHQDDDLTDPETVKLRSVDVAGQYKLKGSDGKTYYTYCADVATDANTKRVYNGQNVEDASYYTEEDAKHIRFICLNGYWGSSEGFGSLDYFTGMLTEKGVLTSEEASLLTPGEAITATQAAIWKFGNSENRLHVDDSIVTGPALISYSFTNLDWAWRDNYIENTGNRIKKIYDYLISGSADPSADITVLTKDNALTGVSVEVLERTSEGGDSGHDTYSVKISFSIGVEILPTDSLVVTLTQDGAVLATVELVSGVMDYTTERVELKENTQIKLSLSGSRELGTGVYIFSSDDPTKDQTLVGVASGTQYVGLEKPLSFDVIYECEAAVSAEKKMLHGSCAEGQFTFILLDTQGETISQASNTSGGTVTFPPVSFTSQDLQGERETVFTYTLREIAQGLPGITYDESEKTVYITLSLSGDKLSAQVSYGDGGNVFIHDQEVATVPVTKIWDDDDNKAGKRPDSVTVRLYANGTDTGKTLVITKENQWTEAFTELEVYDKDGNEITYSVKEVPVAGYSSETVLTEEGYVITNTYAPPPDTFTDSRMERHVLIVCACVMAMSEAIRRMRRQKKTD